MTSTRHKNPKELRITFQDRTSTCPCVHSKWPHYSTPAAFLKNNTLPRKRIIHTHITIHNFSLQSNWKGHVKIIFLNLTYLSFGFHAAMLNRKRKEAKPSSVHYCHLRLLTAWPNRYPHSCSAPMTDLGLGLTLR